jgi:hypothetical protein
VRLTLPRLSGAEALLVVTVLDRVARVIWRAYGDDMADAIGRDHPAPETLQDPPLPRESSLYVATSRVVDDDFDF